MKIIESEKSIIRSGAVLVMSVIALLMCGGCMSGSLKVTAQPLWKGKSELPVKFKFSEISWNSSNLPLWFNKARITKFISLIKDRDPDLFSNDKNAVPLTFYFNHKRVIDNSNGGYNFLAFLTAFTILPIKNDYINTFKVSVQVGPNKEYVETFNISMNEREHLSFIPFYAFFLPPQDNSVCRYFVQFGDEAINSVDLQELFLNMIYSLDKNKLRRFTGSGGSDIDNVFEELRSALPQSVF